MNTPVFERNARKIKDPRRERQPGPTSGWRPHPLRRHILEFVNAPDHAKSAWLRRGVVVMSALELAEAPDGSREVIAQHHVSIGRGGERATEEEVRQALACFGMSDAEEDNHHPGVARHFWMPVDPARRVSCECKVTEEVVTQRDGYTYSQELGTCAGCDLVAFAAARGVVAKPCLIHGATS